MDIFNDSGFVYPNFKATSSEMVVDCSGISIINEPMIVIKDEALDRERFHGLDFKTVLESFARKRKVTSQHREMPKNRGRAIYSAHGGSRRWWG